MMTLLVGMIVSLQNIFGQTQGEIIRVTEHEIYQVKDYTYMLKTPKGLQAEEIWGRKGEFQKFNLDQITIDQSGEVDYWYYFEVTSELSPIFLSLPHLHFSLLELYKIKEGKVTLLSKGGTQTPDHERLLKYPGELFDLGVEKNQVSGYLLRANRMLYKTFSARILSERKLISIQQKTLIIEGILLGVILGVIIYNFLIFIRIKEQEYLLLSIYMFFLLGLLSSISGAIYGLITFTNPEWNYTLFNFFSPATSIFSLWFSVVFLGISKNSHPRFYTIYLIFQGLYLLAIPFSLLSVPVLERLGYFVSGPTSIFLIYIGFSLYKSGFKPAVIYLAAYIPASISVIILTLYIYGLMEYTWAIHNNLLLTVVLQSIFFSLAVASKIRLLKDEKEKILKTQYALLEREVKKRTQELEHSLEDLKTAQKQLIQSEKMASLGELTAGIAHEIQNPLNFVNNFSEVSVELIEEMQEEIEKGDLTEVKSISQDLKENLSKISHHGKRAEFIVKGMLLHSRKSEGKKEPTDLNTLADECLRLSFHGLRAKDKTLQANFKTDLDPNLAPVEIVNQEIGRVLINLINNAFYAVAEKAKSATGDYKPEVIVQTRKRDNGVEVSVKDNGKGIPDPIKDKIFQPFFTTKPSGQGTGLGLSLSYDLVKAHGGELKVQSPLVGPTGLESEGTVFTMYLPLHTQ